MDARPEIAVTDVVCAGEAMAMFVPESLAEPTEKSAYHISAAGAEANVARYLAKLGVPSSWVSRVGDDEFGAFLCRQLAADGVDVSGVASDRWRPTGVAFKERSAESTFVRYYRSGSAASTLGTDDARTVWRAAPRLVHLSGITPPLSESCRAFVLETLRLRPEGAKVSFDLNWRPALWRDLDPSVLMAIARAADIVFVGLDEAEAVWGTTSPEQVRDLLPRSEVLVVKRGADGCTVFGDGERHDVPALRVDVVEPVGAGDAFAAGFLYGHLSGASLSTCARMGTVIASSALSVATDVGEVPDETSFHRLLALDETEWASARYLATN